MRDVCKELCGKPVLRLLAEAAWLAAPMYVGLWVLFWGLELGCQGGSLGFTLGMHEHAKSLSQQRCTKAMHGMGDYLFATCNTQQPKHMKYMSP